MNISYYQTKRLQNTQNEGRKTPLLFLLHHWRLMTHNSNNILKCFWICLQNGLFGSSIWRVECEFCANEKEEMLDIGSSTHVALNWVWFGKYLMLDQVYFFILEKMLFYHFDFILIINMQRKAVEKVNPTLLHAHESERHFAHHGGMNHKPIQSHGDWVHFSHNGRMNFKSYKN